MTISRVNKRRLPFPALVFNIITPPQPPRFYTCHRRQNKGGSTGGHGDGKRAGVPGTPAIFFYLFLFLMSFLYQHNPPSPGEYPIYLTTPRPAARHKKCAICSAFFVFGGYSLSKHKKREQARVFCVWWVSCPLPPSLRLPTPLPVSPPPSHLPFFVQT